MTEPAIAVSRRQVHLLPAAWGGLVGAIGLLVGLSAETGAGLAIAVAAFFAGGFVAGARAPKHRLAHAVLATVCGYLVFALFLVLANVISRAGGPDAPEFAESNLRTALVIAICSLGASLVGAVTAAWRPGARRPR